MEGSPTLQEDTMTLSIVSMGSSEPLACISLDASSTVQALREKVDAECSVGALAYSLMAGGGAILNTATDKLSDLGIEDGESITLVRQRVRDYTKITSFERVFKCGQYPNGVLISPQGELYLCTYYGAIEVYNKDGDLRMKAKVGSSAPSQLVLSPTGDELLVAMRSSGKILVLDLGSLALKRTLRSGGGSSADGSADGLAISGDMVFVSDARNKQVLRYSFESGEVLETAGGFDHPSGLTMIEERLLAVTDRRAGVIRLMSIEGGMKEVRQIGAGKLSKPNDVEVDSGGNLLVMDTGNERIAVFREDGTFVTGIMEGFFKNHGNTFSYLACDNNTGEIAVSNNDEHTIAMMRPCFAG